MKKTLGLIGRVFTIILVSAWIGYDIYLFNATYLCGDKLPMPFGKGNAVIMSGSMEPTISVYDVVIVEKQKEFQIGDIVTFAENGNLVTHRIIEQKGDVFITKGDANNTEDPAISKEEILGKVIYTIPNIGKILLFLQKPIGILCVMLLLLGGMELSFKRNKKAKEKRIALVKAEIEELKKEVQQISVIDVKIKNASKPEEVVIRLKDQETKWMPERILDDDETPQVVMENKQSEINIEETEQIEKNKFKNIEIKENNSVNKENSKIKIDKITNIEKNNKSVIKNIKIKNLAIILLLLVIISLNLVSLTTRKNGSPMTLLGYYMVMIESDSMQPAIQKDDLVFLKAFDEYESGDVITYQENGDLITHRVVSKSQEGYITKGDANTSLDQTFVSKDRIIGKVIMVNGLLGFMVRLFLSPILFSLILGGMIVGFIYKKITETPEKNRTGGNVQNYI